MNWILMAKHQPHKDGYYLVTFIDKPSHTISVDRDYWDDLGEFWEVYRADVIAWAELPSPYKAERKEE